jgi:CRISPR-associated protein Csx3
MYRQFPAIIVGGPPHSGKSVLTYSLTQALRQRDVDHYVLRACPDGEGDWNMESEPKTVRLLRNKGRFTDVFVTRVTRDLEGRHLPLIVDVGGRPTPDQQRIFGYCTHAVLLASDPAMLDTWRGMMEGQGVTVIAELVSTLEEPETIFSRTPVLRARIAGLRRFEMAEGEVIDALVERVAAIFAYAQEELRESHLRAAPAELTVEIDRLGRTLNLLNAKERWEPAAMRPLLEYLPSHEPLAVYGRGPGWLYATLAAYTLPAPFWQYDARLGWVKPVTLHRRGADITTWPIGWRVLPDGGSAPILEAVLHVAYVDYAEMDGAVVPDIDVSNGLIISGKLPHWVLTGLVRAYEDAPWIAAYQPQYDTAAVVVAARGFARRVGDLVPVTLRESTDFGGNLQNA